MRAKYKLGTFVEYVSEKILRNHGFITALIKKPTGYSYQVDDTTVVEESDIRSAFRAIKARVPKKTRTRRKRVNLEETVVV